MNLVPHWMQLSVSELTIRELTIRELSIRELAVNLFSISYLAQAVISWVSVGVVAAELYVEEAPGESVVLSMRKFSGVVPVVSR